MLGERGQYYEIEEGRKGKTRELRRQSREKKFRTKENRNMKHVCESRNNSLTLRYNLVTEEQQKKYKRKKTRIEHITETKKVEKENERRN